MGKTELRTVESFLERMLRHLLKLASAPETLAMRHWRTEIDLAASGSDERFEALDAPTRRA